MESNNDFYIKDYKSAANVNCAPAPSCPLKTSFWTQCSACQMKFKYLICYSNKRLRCRNPNCHKPYVAIEIPPPPIDGNGSSHSKAFSESQPSPNRMRNNMCALVGRQTSPTNASSTSFTSIHLPEKLTFFGGTLTKFASEEATIAPASCSPPSGVLEPVVQHWKRDCEEGAAAVEAQCSEMIQRFKKARSGSVGMSSHVNSLETEGTKKSQVGEGGTNKKVIEDDSQAAFVNGRGLGIGSMTGSQKGRLEGRRSLNFGMNSQFNSLRNLSQIETRKMLIYKAKKKISQKINEWSSEKELADGLNFSQGKVKERYGKEQIAPPNGVMIIAVKHREPVDGKDKVHMKKTSPTISNVETETKNFIYKQMLVANPDFHDFDNDRTEVSFANNQVWAAYDNDDGMPRNYALIHSVTTLKPFKVRISWLNSKSNQELGPMPWVGFGFAKTVGDLQIGKSVVYDSLNAFSHTMRWTKGVGGLIQIYPLKGDVWALYKNWTYDWNKSTADEVKHSYDMVEVIEDCNKDRGVTVAPLIKVCGLKTVFERHSNPCKLWTIPREEMFRFSHQVQMLILDAGSLILHPCLWRNWPKMGKLMENKWMPR
ncbi:hypothetical protein BT93_B0026 [Corymbia citriodora subsp. variegata]|nr:hypothetical protein BT93_B0026 [Corymbia citriodora subsp. variegata]